MLHKRSYPPDYPCVYLAPCLILHGRWIAVHLAWRQAQSVCWLRSLRWRGNTPPVRRSAHGGTGTDAIFIW